MMRLVFLGHAPRYFVSEMTEHISQEKLQASLEQTSPQAGLRDQQELDAAVVFLARHASSDITRLTLALDGGMSVH